MSSIFSSRRHHGSGGVDLLESLMSEKKRLVDCLVRYSGPNGMVRSLGEFLWLKGATAPPCLRMYYALPPWQVQTGLLQEDLDMGVALQILPVFVFYTLITAPRSRKALGGATWVNKGQPEPKTGSHQFRTTKLYYHKDGADKRKEDGFTVIEFVLESIHLQEPRVAICVLHRGDYRGVSPYLGSSTYMSARYGQAPAPGNSLTSLSNPWPSNDNLHGTTMSFGDGIAPPGNSADNPWTVIGNPYTAMSYGYDDYAPPVNSGNMSTINWPMDHNYFDAPMAHFPSSFPIQLPQPDAPVDQISMQNDLPSISFGNSLDAFPPKQNTMTSDNEPRQPDTTYAWVDYFMGITPHYAPDEHFPNSMPWEHNSTLETNHSETLLEPNYYQDGQIN